MEGETETARKITFIVLLSDYEYLNKYIESTYIPETQLRRFTEARERVKNYLLKYPVAGCEDIKKVEDFGYCYDE